jgi:hypothetical protein
MISIRCNLFPGMDWLSLDIQIVDVDWRVNHEIRRGCYDAPVEERMGCLERLFVQLVQEFGAEWREQDVDLPFKNMCSRHHEHNSHLHLLHGIIRRRS